HVSYDRIEVVIHPTSIVHGLVRFRDGATIAHLGYPDMRVPISYALTYPERAATPVPPLELHTLEFHEPDADTFRMLALAREAAGSRPPPRPPPGARGGPSRGGGWGPWRSGRSPGTGPGGWTARPRAPWPGGSRPPAAPASWCRSPDGRHRRHPRPRRSRA